VPFIALFLYHYWQDAVAASACLQNFPWPVPPFEELTEDSAKLLNEKICIILFTGKFYCFLLSRPVYHVCR